IFRDHQWERGALIRFGPENEASSNVPGIRVVTCAGGIHLFMDFGETLLYREGLPEKDGGDWSSWEPVAPSATYWSAVCEAGELAVYVLTSEISHDTLAEFRRHPDTWAKQRDLPLQTFGASLGVVPEDGGTRMFLLAGLAGESLGVMELKDGKIEGRGKYYRGEAESRFGSILSVFLLAGLAYLAAPI